MRSVFNVLRSLLLLFVISLLPGCNNLAAQSGNLDGFKQIFNGANFEGWDINPDKGAWKVKDGVILCAGDPMEPYLILSNNRYENFELYIDYKALVEDCNSGIVLHQANRHWGRESRIGMEIQIDNNAGAIPTAQTCGAIYGVLPAISNPVKPVGHWNTYYILMDWPILKVWLNGQMIQDVNLEKEPKLKYRLRNGYLGLQNHFKEIEFRNIYIKELKGKERWTNLFDGNNLNSWDIIGDAKWRIENDEIVVTGGDGYLVSKQEYDNYEFQVFAGKYEVGGNSGLFYNWLSADDPGLKVDFRKTDFRDDLKGVDNILRFCFLLTQVVSSNKESFVIVNGNEIQRFTDNKNNRKGKFAFYHSAKDGVVRLPLARVKEFSETKK
jgi:hypothetical protein